MKHIYFILLVVLVLSSLGGFFIGYSLQEANNTLSPQHAAQPADKTVSKTPAMNHVQLNIENSTEVPTVTLSVNRDLISGYNVHLETSNFTFTPEHAGNKHVDKEGHVHLYVNSVKIARMYGNWFHIPSLEPGENEIRVTLNTNDHKEYARNGKTIEASQVIMVTEEEHNNTPHDH